MRVQCPCCQKRFDVRHVEILKEAERLKEWRRNGDLEGAGNVNGNIKEPEPRGVVQDRGQ